MLLSKFLKIFRSSAIKDNGEGCTVRCINDKTDLDLDASTQLKAGGLYTLVDIDAHAFYAWYYLKEFPGIRFNSVRFEHLDRK